MLSEPNKLSQFWQELKRRKVVRVITVYAAAAFVILELVSIIVDPLRLPEWTLTFIIVVLCVGFIIAVILSWVYDVTPEGLKKTELATDAKATVVIEKAAKKRLKLSDIAIAVLLVLVLILAYPKIFNGGGNLKAMTHTATFINEFGIEETRQVFKEEYVHKLMILPFQAEETDTINSWLKYGIPDGLWEDLLQFQYVLPYGNMEATHLQEQINSAKINNCPYFLTGTYKKTDDYYKITSRLHQTVNGSVERERIYQGKDLFNLLDSISLQVRFDLGISKNIIDLYPDLPFQEHTTDNLNAYKYFVLGLYSEELLSGNIFSNLSKASELDSTFALASYWSAFYCHWWQFSKIDALKFINHAMRHRRRLPEYRDIQTRILNYSIQGEKDKSIALSEMQFELQPYNIELLNALIQVYEANFLYNKATNASKKLNHLVPGHPEYQIQLLENYLLADKIDEGQKFIEGIIEENPENPEFQLMKGQFHLHNNELNHAEKAFQKAMLLSPDNEKNWSLMLDHVNFVRNKNATSVDLQKFTGMYRAELQELCWETVIHNGYLYRKAINQNGLFYYPISDTSFTGSFGFISFSFNANNQGKISRLINTDDNNHFTTNIWKEDSLILKAKKLLESNRSREALIAFQKAYSENPEHYYLANYIKHLEFIQSPEYEKMKPVLETYAGEYGNSKFYKKNDRFYLEGIFNKKLEILPLSENQFMSPSVYFIQIEFSKEENQAMVMKIILNDGRVRTAIRTVDPALASHN